MELRGVPRVRLVVIDNGPRAVVLVSSHEELFVEGCYFSASQEFGINVPWDVGIFYARACHFESVIPNLASYDIVDLGGHTTGAFEVPEVPALVFPEPPARTVPPRSPRPSILCGRISDVPPRFVP